MTREELLKDENVRRFVAETSDEERARLLRIMADFQLVSSAMELEKTRSKSAEVNAGTRKLFGEPLDAALARLSKDGPFIQALMGRLGEQGFQAVMASDVIVASAKSQAPDMARKVPSLIGSGTNEAIAALATSGTIMMTCGTAGGMVAAGGIGALMGASAGGAGGMAAIFVGGMLAGAGAVYMSEYC